MAKLQPTIESTLKDNPMTFDKLILSVNTITEVDTKLIEKRVNKLITQRQLSLNDDLISLPELKKPLILKEEFSKFMSVVKKDTKSLECVHPCTTECSEKIIKAHSIQNSRILTKIARNGYVMQVKAEESIFTDDMSEIGRKTATTFTGFCGKHDYETFRLIEETDYEPNNVEQEFLFAYRTLAREVVIKKQVQKINEILKNIESNNSLKDMTHDTNLAIRDLFIIKSKFNSALISKNYDVIETKQIVLSEEYPIAVSSIFTIEYDFEGNLVNDLSEDNTVMKDIFFTVFPQNGKTYVLLSYFKEDSDVFSFFESQVLNLTESEQIKRINLLIAAHCENFVYSPKKWELMHSSEKAAFMQFFTKTAISSKNLKILAEEVEFNLLY